MSLIERYLSEIARRLPKRQREDVRNELRSALGDALDGQVEGEANEDEVVELLREFGSPDAVAASYRPESQYLIGPDLFPTFKTVMGIVITILVSLVVLGFAIDLAVDPPEGMGVLIRLLELLSEIWDTALAAFAIVVIVFGILQWFASVEPEEESWDPRELPEALDAELVGPGDAIIGIALPIVFLALLNLLKGHYGVFVEPGGEILLNDVFQDNLLWINLALGAGIVLNVWLLRTGRWLWPSRLFDWAINFYWIWILFKISGEVAARETELVTAGVPERIAGMMIKVVELIPWFVVLLVVWGIATSVYRGFRSDSVRLAANLKKGSN
jgi:hypothetical protein